MATTNPFSSKEAFASTMEALFRCPDSELESKMLGVFSKDAVITMNERQLIWDGLFPYFKAIRDQLVSVEIKVHHFLQDGNMIAEKHTSSGIGKDGVKTQADVFCILKMNEDNRVIWLEEMIRFTAGVNFVETIKTD